MSVAAIEPKPGKTWVADEEKGILGDIMVAQCPSNEAVRQRCHPSGEAEDTQIRAIPAHHIVTPGIQLIN